MLPLVATLTWTFRVGPLSVLGAPILCFSPPRPCRVLFQSGAAEVSVTIHAGSPATRLGLISRLHRNREHAIGLPMPRTIVITGASSGIGEALALRYASERARLGLLGRNNCLDSCWID